MESAYELAVERTPVSSANVVNIVVSVGCGKSAVYNVYRRGPSTLPCGTPAAIGWSGEEAAPYTTKNSPLCRYLAIKS